MFGWKRGQRRLEGAYSQWAIVSALTADQLSRGAYTGQLMASTRQLSRLPFYRAPSNWQNYCDFVPVLHVVVGWRCDVSRGSSFLGCLEAAPPARYLATPDGHWSVRRTHHHSLSSLLRAKLVDLGPGPQTQHHCSPQHTASAHKSPQNVWKIRAQGPCAAGPSQGRSHIGRGARQGKW